MWCATSRGRKAMRKIIFVGRSGCGKTTLTQAVRGERMDYHKTQYISYHDAVIDTPGEYAENHHLARALALYGYEADVVGLLLSAAEPYSLYSPCVTSQANREVVGIVTQIDHPDGDADRAERWLRLAGCERVFRVSAVTGDGIDVLRDYLGIRQAGQTKPNKNKEK